MKIAILTSSFPRKSGDYQGNFIYYQARGQVEIGHEVHVICPHVPGTPFSETMEGVHVHRFPYFFPFRLQRLSGAGGMYSALLRSPLAALQVPFFLISGGCCALRIIRRNRIDLLHTHWFVPSGLVGAVLASLLGIPHVISSHVLDANLFDRFRITRPFLSLIIRSADCITTNSRYTRQRIEALVRLRIPCYVIPMGVILPENLPASEKNRKPAVLFVGRLVEWKGADTLIRSLLYIRKQVPDVQCFIVGEGSLGVPLQRLVEDQDLTEIVRFCGKVTNEELARLYGSASVLVLPSRSSRGLVMEGLGIVLLEAMSHGVPVVGSDVGGIPDIIEDGKNGFLFPPESEEILAKKVVRILSDRDLADQFRRAGYETVRTRFLWGNVSRQFSDVYDQVLIQRKEHHSTR